MGKTSALVVLLLLVIPFASAIQIEGYQLDYILKDNGLCDVHHQIELLQSNNTFYELNIPSNSYNITVKSSDKEVEYSLIKQGINQVLRFKITALTEDIDILYTTDMFTTKAGDFSIFGSSVNLPASNTFMSKVVLPERAILAKPSEQFASSYYPKGQVTSDGQHIIINWSHDNIVGDYSMMVVYKLAKKGLPLWIIVIAGLGLILTWIAIYFMYIKRKPKVVKEKEIVKEKEFIVPNLKEQESAVVEALKLKEGKADQGTLRVVLGMPKSTLSVILKELETRNVIYKEKRGNKNMVFLKEAQVNPPEPKEEINEPSSAENESGSGDNN